MKPMFSTFHEMNTNLSATWTQIQNLYVSRTFSFAYGLAGADGYLLGLGTVSGFEGAVTNYRLGTLQEQLAIAALTDENHIDELLEMTAKDREQICHFRRVWYDSSIENPFHLGTSPMDARGMAGELKGGYSHQALCRCSR